MQDALSPAETKRFHLDGYLGPFTVFAADEMATINQTLHEQVFRTPGPNPRDPRHCRHLDSPAAWSIVSHPTIVGRLNALIGNDVVCWSSGFFIKEAHGGAATAWHQDINYWPIEPPLNITAWVATQRVSPESSPLRLIPGSHSKMLPHRKVAGLTLDEEADPAFFDISKAVSFPMDAGQCVLFVERLLHGAGPNTADHRRCAMAIRYTVPFVRLFPDRPPINFPRHRALLVSGKDTFGFNALGEPPAPAAMPPSAG